MVISVLNVFASTIPESRCWKEIHLKIVFETSVDHALIQDSSRLSTNISGVSSRKTAVPILILIRPIRMLRISESNCPGNFPTDFTTAACKHLLLLLIIIIIISSSSCSIITINIIISSSSSSSRSSSVIIIVTTGQISAASCAAAHGAAAERQESLQSDADSYSNVEFGFLTVLRACPFFGLRNIGCGCLFRR